MIKLLVPSLILLSCWLSTSTPIAQQQHSTKEYLLGKVKPAHDTLFVRVANEYLSHPHTIYLEKNTCRAYYRMYAEAKKEGITLKLISGLRTFSHQKAIWEAKWNGQRKVEGQKLNSITDKTERARIILKYSSMPGTSRHHWGTDIDLYSLNSKDFAKGEGLKAFNWLNKHAHHYGFCRPYTAKDSLRPTGYEEEEWHWSYFPLSEKLLKEYRKLINYSDISGFDGCASAEPLKVIENYVFTINRECK